MGRVLRIVTLAALCALSPAARAAAQDQGPATSAFEKLPDSQLVQEQLPAAPLVFAAYAFVWLAMIVYVFTLWRRVRRAEQDLAEVSTRLGAGPR